MPFERAIDIRMGCLISCGDHDLVGSIRFMSAQDAPKLNSQGQAPVGLVHGNSGGALRPQRDRAGVGGLVLLSLASMPHWATRSNPPIE